MRRHFFLLCRVFSAFVFSNVRGKTRCAWNKEVGAPWQNVQHVLTLNMKLLFPKGYVNLCVLIVLSM